MDAVQADMHFPVLGFTPDRDAFGFADFDTLTSSGPRSLKAGRHVGMELIDAEGRRWIVRSVRRIGRAGSFGPWLLSALMTAVPQSRVEYELDALDPVSLSDVQTRLCDFLAAFPDFLCEEEELRPAALVDLSAQVRATTAIADMLDLLGLDSFMAR